ncbi:hypothetical protein PybrP1_009747 [[Pythium] brassicae (nom. inval.)]|nr:hypothetical protein PybrP1_009747 [[Pythium] brassicae (nom. inval.)]
MAPQRRSCRVRAALAFLSLLLCQVASDDSSSNGEEPTSPVCRLIPKNSLAFCSMVDYVAVVDAADANGATFDAKAKFYYENADVVLQRFGCHARYSLYKCDDCRDAYKYWVCSIKFQKCGQGTSDDSDDKSAGAGHASRICDVSDVACESGATGRHRTCLSLCEDVVRKCPYVLNFQCPTTDTVFFSTDIATCNKMDRTQNPDHPELPWPGTFADS